MLRRRNIARVSRTPGKTQAVQFYLINERIYLVDLPGYGYAKVSRSVSASWGPLVTGYLEGSSALRLIFVLLDVRRELSAADLRLIEWLDAHSVPWQAVLTKADKLSNHQMARRRQELADSLQAAPDTLIPFSSMTRRGVAELWSRIEQAVESINVVPKHV